MDKPSRILFRACQIAMTLSCALLYSATTTNYHALIIASLILALPLFVRNKMRYNDRTLIYTIVFFLIVSYVFDLIFPTDKNNYFLIGDIFATGVSAPFLLFLASSTVLFTYNEHAFGASTALCLTSVLLTSDVNWALSGLSRSAYLYFYLANVLLVTISLIVGLQANRRLFLISTGIVQRSNLLRNRILLVCLAILVSICITLVGGGLLVKFESKITAMDLLVSKYALFYMQRGRVTVFSKEVNLNRTIAPETRRNSEKIIMRAFSPSPPGYLRGRVYDRYSSGRWTDGDSENVKMRMVRQDDVFSFSRFLDPDASEDVFKDESMTLMPDDKFMSDVLLVPGATRGIDAMATSVSRNLSGVVSPSDWNSSSGYTPYVPQKTGMDSARNSPSPPFKIDYLQVPEHLNTCLENYLKELFEKRGSYTFESDQDFADFLQNHFVSTYRYKLHHSAPEKPGEEPIVSFIARKDGHCELFATAMLLLLRKSGLPARYVTGFICEERNPLGEHYVARLGNAHAWLEVYLRDQKKWVLCEPTPAEGISNFKHSMGAFSSFLDMLKASFLKMADDVRKGFFAKAVIDFFLAIIGIFKSRLWLSALLFLALASVLLFIGRRKFAAKRRYDYMTSPGRLKASKHFFRSMDKISSGLGVARKKFRSIEAWISALNERAPHASIEISELFQEYQRLRFSSIDPGKDECRVFAQRLLLLKRSLDKK